MVCFFINLFDSYILLILLKIDLSVKKKKNEVGIILSFI